MFRTVLSFGCCALGHSSGTITEWIKVVFGKFVVMIIVSSIAGLCFTDLNTVKKGLEYLSSIKQKQDRIYHDMKSRTTTMYHRKLKRSVRYTMQFNWTDRNLRKTEGSTAEML